VLAGPQLVDHPRHWPSFLFIQTLIRFQSAYCRLLASFLRPHLHLVLLIRHHHESPFLLHTGVGQLISRTFYYLTPRTAPSLCGVVSSVSVRLNKALPFQVLCQALAVPAYLYLPVRRLAVSVQRYLDLLWHSGLGLLEQHLGRINPQR
jgi:hypothetical protein